MTYEAYESGVEQSPVELYEFVFGPNHFRYTSAAEPITLGANVFTPYPIVRDKLRPDKPLTVRAFRDLPIALLFRTQPPSSVVSLVVRRMHLNDPDRETRIIWMGRVLNAEWSGNETILTCETDFISMKRKGLRRHYQKTCPFDVYGPDCGLNAADWRIGATEYTISGLTLTVPSLGEYDEGHFAGGFIQYLNPRYFTQDYYSIRSSSGPTITLFLYPQHLEPPTLVYFLPGCDQTRDTCLNKFDNLPAYGGQLYLPDVNPMTGGKVY